MASPRGMWRDICSLSSLMVLLCSPLPASAVKIGEPAPSVSLASLPAGQETRLFQLRGKVVYIDFWASWCGPCRISLPALDDIYRELNADGFEMLAINVDEIEQDALDFLEKIPVSYPVVWDPTGDTPSRYQILGMPTAFLVDRNGVVREIHTGFRKSDAKKIRASIMELLSE